MGAQEQRVGVRHGVEQPGAGADGLGGVDVDAAVHVGAGELHGVVDAVAGDQRVAVAAAQFDGDLSRGVSRGRDEQDARRDLVPLLGYVHEVVLSGVAYGGDGVAEHLASGLVQVGGGPVVPFGAAGEVAGVGEGGNPVVTGEAGVPADVVGVQVRGDHEVHGLGRETGRRQALQEVGVESVPGRVGARLGVADAGVHDDPQPARLHRETVARQTGDVGVGEVRAQPRRLVQHLFGGVRQQPGPGLARQFDLVDTTYGDVAEAPSRACG